MPKISIIIPVYKVKEEYLRQCFDSCCKQTMSDIEIFVIVDGRNEKVEEICEEYRKRYEKFGYILQENHGVSNARNQGIQNAKGDFICFLDADDWIEVQYCEKLYRCAKKTKCELIVTGYCDNYISLEIPHPIEKSVPAKMDFSEKLIIKNYFGVDEGGEAINLNSPWGKLIKKSLLLKNHIVFNESLKYGEDALFNFIVLHSVKAVGILHDCGYHYRIRKTAITNENVDKIIDLNDKYLLELEKILPNYSNYNLYYEALEFYKLHKWKMILFSGDINYITYTKIVKRIRKLKDNSNNLRLTWKDKLLTNMITSFPIFIMYFLIKKRHKYAQFCPFE